MLVRIWERHVRGVVSVVDKRSRVVEIIVYFLMGGKYKQWRCRRGAGKR